MKMCFINTIFGDNYHNNSIYGYDNETKKIAKDIKGGTKTLVKDD